MFRKSPPPTLEETIGLQIRWRRRQLGLNQGQLARKSGVSTSAMSKIENGRISATISSLKNVAEALGVPINLLFMPLSAEPIRVAAAGHVRGSSISRPNFSPAAEKAVAAKQRPNTTVRSLI